MKKKSLLTNPFTRVAGSKALLIGLVVMIVAAVVGAYSRVYFDGALDIHAKPIVNVEAALLFMATGYIALVIVFYLLGLLLSKNVRFIDIAGTVALARAPYLLIALVGFLVSGTVNNITPDNIPGKDGPMSGGLIFFTILAVVVVVWHIMLLYNAYRESTGLKNTKGIISFIVGILLAEALSVLLLLKVVVPVFL